VGQEYEDLLNQLPKELMSREDVPDESVGIRPMGQVEYRSVDKAVNQISRKGKIYAGWGGGIYRRDALHVVSRTRKSYQPRMC
jgi:hypothetical protein